MLRRETGFVPGAQRITRHVFLGYRQYRTQQGKIIKVPRIMVLALGRRKTYQLAKRMYVKGEWEAIVTAANNRIRNAKQ